MSFDPYTLRMMIKEFGSIITLKKQSVSSYNEDTGTVTATPTDVSVRGYIYEYDPEHINGDTIIQGDKRVLLDIKDTSNQLITPVSTKDQVLVTGKLANIVKVSTIIASGVVVCYMLQVRD